MLTLPLLVGVGGLALLDSLNPATLLTVALILLLPSRRPALSALVFLLGALLTVVAAGVLLLGSAEGLARAGGLDGVRRVAFGLAAVALARAAVRRLRDRERAAWQLPAWFSPRTALPLGALVTGLDLPNAFPYALAVERLVAAEVPLARSVLVVLAYAVVYCLPGLVLLLAGLRWADVVRRRLDPLYARFGAAGTLPRSVPVAAALAVLAVGVAAIAATA